MNTARLLEVVEMYNSGCLLDGEALQLLQAEGLDGEQAAKLLVSDEEAVEVLASL